MRLAATTFEELLERHEREIYRFAWRMTGNPEDAADVLQETFLSAFRAWKKLPAGSNYRAWLFRIAAHAALNVNRGRRRRRSVPLDEAVNVAESNGDLEGLVETRRLARSLGVAIRALPSRQRVALLLRKYEGSSYREIAATLGCSETTARAHVYQAMSKVRRVLAGSDGRGGSS